MNMKVKPSRTYVADAADLCDFKAPDVARVAGYQHDSAVTNAYARERKVGSLGQSVVMRFAEAFNAILARRGDPRRFTAQSLREGPDPQMPGDDAPSRPLSLVTAGSSGIGKGQLSGLSGSFGIGVDERRLRELLGDVRFDGGEMIALRSYDGASCGSFDPTLPDPRMRTVLRPRELLPPGTNDRNTVLLRARGDSMAGAPDAHIHDGDELAVRLGETPRDGDIVVAVSNGGVAVRRLRDGYLVSEPEIGTAPSIVPASGDQILGVVVFIGRQVRRGGR